MGGRERVALVVLPCGVVEWRCGGAAILCVTVPASLSEACCHNMTQTADILLFMSVKVHESMSALTRSWVRNARIFGHTLLPILCLLDRASF